MNPKNSYRTTSVRPDGVAIDALAAAFAGAAPTTARQDALGVEALTSRPALEALADYLDSLHTSNTLAGTDVATIGLARLAQARDLARAAALHGYPRPALEALASEADRLPSARTSDPSTSHDARPRKATRGNHLGKLLVGFLMYEGLDYGDSTLTSEELAHRVGLGGSEYAKRMSDLTALGYVRVARDDDGHERTRRGDSGRQRLVFELTDAGRQHAAGLLRS